MKQLITTTEAPKAIGAYSQACRSGNLVFLSGQIGLDPQTAELVSSEVAPQLKQAILNLEAVCRAANLNLSQIVKLNVYLMDMADFSVVNTLISEYFEPNFPARAVVQVAGLPKNARIEIDAIAVD